MSGSKADLIRRLRSPPKPEVIVDVDDVIQPKSIVEREFDSLLAELRSQHPHRSFEDIQSEARDRLSEPLPDDLVKNVLWTYDKLHKNVSHHSQMIGYPNWYRENCSRWKSGVDEWPPEVGFGPNITTRVQLAKYLLKMTWKEFPIYSMDKFGWGYLIPETPCQSQLVQVRFLYSIYFVGSPFLSLGQPSEAKWDSMGYQLRQFLFISIVHICPALYNSPIARWPFYLLIEIFHISSFSLSSL